MGSSPQARGTHLFPVLVNNLPGLIPAGAGNTGGVRTTLNVPRAHPRRRGEHEFHGSCCGAWLGSSPQARGTPLAPLRGVGGCGLIPAGAGNTRPAPIVHRGGGAHPRRRGEHASSAVFARMSAGSSPQARGTRLPRRGACTCVGLIPAGAGNTATPTKGHSLTRAHPRRRGEHPSVCASRDMM